MRTQIKLGLGSVLSTFGVLGIVLAPLLEWTAMPRPWPFLLGFAFGLAAGLGATLVIAGLIERRRGN
jgi:predicted ABC-type sugar transport system permease subunit